MKPGPKPRGPFTDKRRAFTTQITDDTRAKLESAAQASGRSLTQEVELLLRQALDRRSPLDEAFELAYGGRGGFVRFLGEIVRGGGGSRALIAALEPLAIPDLREQPEMFGLGMVFDVGYDEPELDNVKTVDAARWRTRLGPKLAPLFIDAYHRLRPL